MYRSHKQTINFQALISKTNCVRADFITKMPNLPSIYWFKDEHSCETLFRSARTATEEVGQVGHRKMCQPFGKLHCT